MRELQAILDRYARLGAEEIAALATIVKVAGSAYRRPGARMLILPDGETIGSISGGCLESDVRERARRVMETGEPMLVTYDSTAADDVIFGLGLGCNGIVHLLIEPLDRGDEAGSMVFLAGCVRRRQFGVMATVLHVEGEARSAIGAHWMLDEGGGSAGCLADLEIAAQVEDAMRHALHSRRSVLREWSVAEGSVEIFIEVVPPPVPLVIFGAGHDAIPVTQFARQLGWYVTVVDHRPAYAVPDRLPGADIVLCTPYEATAEHVALDMRTVAIIMTHHYLHDRELLKTLLPLPLRYLGILGPRSRTERLLSEIEAEHQKSLPTEWTRRLHGPAGLDIGAETPEEIALSILAEIQAALTERSGGSLRDYQGPIHDSSSGPASSSLSSQPSFLPDDRLRHDPVGAPRVAEPSSGPPSAS